MRAKQKSQTTLVATIIAGKRGAFIETRSDLKSGHHNLFQDRIVEIISIQQDPPPHLLLHWRE